MGLANISLAVMRKQKRVRKEEKVDVIVRAGA
jgi:hypothetical protein